MSLSQRYESVGHRRCEHGSRAQAPNHAGEIEAPVEAIAELGEVAGQMLGTNCMVSSLQGVLDVAQQRIDPEQGLAPLPSLGAAGPQRLMSAAGLLDRGKAAQPIGTDVGAGRQVLAAPAAELAAATIYVGGILEKVTIGSTTTAPRRA